MTIQLKLVLDDIKNHKIFKDNDFRLVGGTALAYHIEHRLSEDLDFFINNDLPRDDIDNFIEFCIDLYGEDKVIYIQPSDNTMYETLKDGMDIDDMQQDWNINGVKVTFCDASSNVGITDICNEDLPSLYGNVKISSAKSIFKMKSLMFYKRAKIRDYFDLFTLYNNNVNYFSANRTMNLIQKYENAYKGKSGKELFFIILKQKIDGYNSQNDAPLNTLIENAPSFNELAEFIISNLKK